uniref:Uncharacterized protein n=1 Tax=Ciona savignyi TaxID=51511 RepID=H2Y7G8_CIOSA
SESSNIEILSKVESKDVSEKTKELTRLVLQRIEKYLNTRDRSRYQRPL